MKIVYGSEFCPACKKLVDELLEKGEKFDYVDMNTLSIKEIEKLKTKVKSLNLPIVLE